MAEFLMRTDLTPIQSWKLEANFEEMQKELQEMMSPYKSLVVTVDTVDSAKKDLEKARKVEKGIDEVRKTVKGLWTTPLKEFEEKCKALNQICADAIKNLDSQVKSIEQEEKDKKMYGLKTYFEEAAGDVKDYISFDVIFNPRWGNKTFPIEDAREEILSDIQKCVQEVNTIRSVAGKYETALLTEYARTHDLNGAVRLKSVLEEREEKERVRKEAEKKTVYNSVDPKFEMEFETKIEISFKVRVTKEQMDGLKRYMRENGIRPEKI